MRLISLIEFLNQPVHNLLGTPAVEQIIFLKTASKITERDCEYGGPKSCGCDNDCSDYDENCSRENCWPDCHCYGE